MKKITIKISWAIVLGCLPIVSFAAEATESGGNTFLYSFTIGDYFLFGIGAVVFLVAGWTMFRFTMLMVKEKETALFKAQGLDAPPVVEQVKEPSLWSKLSSRLSDAVPVEKEKQILMDHDYDGIRELDNNLPPWWLYGFYLSIVVAIFYIGYYHFSANAKSSAEEYELEMKQAAVLVSAYRARFASKVDESNLVALVEETELAEGQTIFLKNCIACHLETGGGSPISVGPNLTDEYWLHGGGIKNVYATIKYGVPEKGMIAWKAQLSPLDMHKVASYIMTLADTNPPNAKAPQGERWTADAAED